MAPTKVLHHADIAKLGTAEELEQWAATHLLAVDDFGTFVGVGGTGMAMNRVQAQGYWGSSGGDPVTALMSALVDASSRLTAAGPVGRHQGQRGLHPLQLILARPQLERDLSRMFRKAFGMDLMLSRMSGDELALHCGTEPKLGAPSGDRAPFIELEKEVSELPRLDAQGDGMKSFVGTVLQVVVPGRSVLLIDEPEAFLHPPQAKLLGAELSKFKSEQQQLFLATHSGDLLRGLLDADPKNLMVIRLQRNGDRTEPTTLTNDEVRRLWADPLLRSSNALDALFHQGVVVCEGDADCRFYKTLLEPADGEVALDLMFCAAGGKERLPVLVSALAKLGVRVATVADIDVLGDERLLRTLYENMGGNWDKIGATWRQVDAAVRHPGQSPTTRDTLAQMSLVLDGSDRELTAGDVKRIREIARLSNGWSQAKRIGIAAIPRGEMAKKAEELLVSLAAVGLFIPECGELEGFCRSIPGHGPGWVSDALQKDVAGDADFAKARRFGKRIASFFRIKARGHSGGQ